MQSISSAEMHETWLASIQKEATVVQLLLDVSQILNKTPDIEEALRCILAKMAEQAGMKEGTITILGKETGEPELDLRYGTHGEDPSKRRAKKEIADRVQETGIPVIVEETSQKLRFLDEGEVLNKEIGLRLNEPISQISVPIRNNDGTIGVLSANRLFPERKTIEEEARILTRIAGLLADAIAIRSEARRQEHLLQEKLKHLQSEIMDRFKPAAILGGSHAIQRVRQLTNQVSATRADVLITGEAGTGKELVARAIHANSPRKEKPFIKLDIAALPQTGVSRQLFGGSPDQRINGVPGGCLEMAKGGTLFLDEIGHLPMAVQTGLLRVLQERESESTEDNANPIDVRIIAATSRDLETLVQKSEFRLDLFYRLNAFPIFVPPLRERKTDIVPLVNHFIEQFGKKHAKSICRISAHSIDIMMRHDWPGNVLELEACVERAVLLSTDGVIHAQHLPPSIQVAEQSDGPLRSNLKAWTAALEQDLIVDALKSALGNTARAARFLGINRLLMRRRIKKYEIDFERFKRKPCKNTPGR
jgi:Nif-specific regulatory protein